MFLEIIVVQNISICLDVLFCLQRVSHWQYFYYKKSLLKADFLVKVYKIVAITVVSGYLELSGATGKSST